MDIFYLLSPCHLRVHRPLFLPAQIDAQVLFSIWESLHVFINISCIISPSSASFLKWGSKDAISKCGMHLCGSIKTFLLFTISLPISPSIQFYFFSFSHSYCTFSRHFYTIIINQCFFPNGNLDSITVYFSLELFILVCTILSSSTLNFNCQVVLWSLSMVRLFYSPVVHPCLSYPVWSGIIRRLFCLILHLFQDCAEQHQTQ